jgi:predicted SnoaL-like aldol condensation-catalyzing enzyme
VQAANGWREKRERNMKRVVLGAALALAAFGAAHAGESAQEQANKKAVIAFYDAALNKLDYEAAVKFIGADYKQHNPTAKDGKEGFKDFIAFLKANFPQTHSEITQSFADGDYVILRVHTLRTPGTLGNAIIDIFRLEKGKVVEHWDSVQAVPDKPANTNTMF